MRPFVIFVSRCNASLLIPTCSILLFELFRICLINCVSCVNSNFPCISYLWKYVATDFHCLSGNCQLDVSNFPPFLQCLFGNSQFQFPSFNIKTNKIQSFSFREIELAFALKKTFFLSFLCFKLKIILLHFDGIFHIITKKPEIVSSENFILVFLSNYAGIFHFLFFLFSAENYYAVGDPVYAHDLWLVVELPSDDQGRRTAEGREAAVHVCSAILAAQKAGWTPLIVGGRSNCCR